MQTLLGSPLHKGEFLCAVGLARAALEEVATYCLADVALGDSEEHRDLSLILRRGRATLIDIAKGVLEPSFTLDKEGVGSLAAEPFGLS